MPWRILGRRFPSHRDGMAVLCVWANLVRSTRRAISLELSAFLEPQYRDRRVRTLQLPTAEGASAPFSLVPKDPLVWHTARNNILFYHNAYTRLPKPTNVPWDLISPHISSLLYISKQPVRTQALTLAAPSSHLNLPSSHTSII